MFDTFDILVPELATSGIELRQHQSVFGPAEDQYVYVGGLKFARLLLARDAFSNVRAWTGSDDRAMWTVLLANAEAGAAAAQDDSWTKFLEALKSVLRAHSFWRVTCESDCDQHPLERVTLSPEAFAELLDSYRREGARPIAVQATPDKDPCDLGA